jgi:hypothetical protein
MIRKSGRRFSEKIMLKQNAREGANGEKRVAYNFSARPRESGDPGWIPACAGMSGWIATRHSLLATRSS